MPHRRGETNCGGAQHNEHKPRHQRANEAHIAKHEGYQKHRRHHERARGAELVHVPPGHTLRCDTAHYNGGGVHKSGKHHHNHGDARGGAANARVQHRGIGNLTFESPCGSTLIPHAAFAGALFGTARANRIRSGIRRRGCARNSARTNLYLRLDGGFLCGALRAPFQAPCHARVCHHIGGERNKNDGVNQRRNVHK